MEEGIKEKDMTPILVKDLGMKYATEQSKQKNRFGLFKCQYCSKEFKTRISSVKTGNTRSCGCLPNKGNTSHGLRHHRLYKTWNAMIHRCYYISSPCYLLYGNRGITVCEDWKDVKKFIKWAEETHIEGLTLDRIDNDKGYSPDNCRWANRTVQATNQRKNIRNTSGYVGVSWYKVASKWASSICINKKHIYLGLFEDKMEAVKARDDYIKEHNLPHKLSTKY